MFGSREYSYNKTSLQVRNVLFERIFLQENQTASQKCLDWRECLVGKNYCRIEMFCLREKFYRKTSSSKLEMFGLKERNISRLGTKNKTSTPARNVWLERQKHQLAWQKKIHQCQLEMFGWRTINRHLSNILHLQLNGSVPNGIWERKKRWKIRQSSQRKKTEEKKLRSVTIWIEGHSNEYENDL